jgi:hypothetical protein
VIDCVLKLKLRTILARSICAARATRKCELVSRHRPFSVALVTAAHCAGAGGAFGGRWENSESMVELIVP